MPRPKRGDPEMLLVSFCDIVTITICAMFMAMIIVIDEASKIPVVSPVPVQHPSTNAPVYFECRDNMIYPIDFRALTETFSKYSTEFKKSAGSNDIEKILSLDIGNKYFQLHPGLATLGIMALQARPGVLGVTSNDLAAASAKASAAALAALTAGGESDHSAPTKTEPISQAELDSEKNLFSAALANMDKDKQLCVFFVRDSGFSIFRVCRRLVVQNGYKHGWEYVATDEPLTFDGMMLNPGSQ